MIGGIAVSSLGHDHPALVEAVSVQAARLAHTSNLFLHEKEVELAEKLLELWGNPGRVFLCNSGTEANEAALKLAILHGNATGKTRIMATENGFHGRSLGALSITGKAGIREPFAPFGRDVVFVPYGDLDALKAAVDDTDGRSVLRTHPGRDRGRPGPRRIPQGRKGTHRRERRPPDPGRDPVRVRAHRRLVRPHRRRHRPRRR